MTLIEILKEQGLSDEQIQDVTGKMKQNKIFTSTEENLDVRYGKLKTDHEGLIQKQAESDKLIAELQKASKDNEGIQSKIAEYEATIKNQQEELEHTKIESALKVALLGAKATDVDYLAFKLKENGQEFKLDDEGNIKNISDMVADLKVQFPNQFETSSQKKFEEKKLPEDNSEKKMSREEFNKMGYQSRLQIKQENPDLYNELTGRKTE